MDQVTNGPQDRETQNLETRPVEERFAGSESPVLAPLGGERPKAVAPWWHTLILAVLMLVFSYLSAKGLQSGRIQNESMITRYSRTVIYQFLLVGLVWIGLRIRRTSLAELIGGRWNTWDDFFRDAAIAVGIIVLAFGLIVSIRLATGGMGTGTKQFEESKKLIEAMAPRRVTELFLFFLLSCTAGFCEEIVFRGYFQRQFAAFSRNVWVGLGLSAAVFGLCHAYQGIQAMIIIALYGALLGGVAVWRKSLRPGMIAHATFDSAQGILLFVASRLLEKHLV